MAETRQMKDSPDAAAMAVMMVVKLVIKIQDGWQSLVLAHSPPMHAPATSHRPPATSHGHQR
jgi:hypothetical protein